MTSAAFDHLAATLAERTAGDDADAADDSADDDAGIGGLAWAVSHQGQVASGAAGWLDAQRRQRVADDSIFRIASISKPIAAVAALQLVDRGVLELDDPLDPWLPELTNRQVLIDPSGPLDGPTVAAERPLTLRDLLTSRCGLGMDFNFGEPQPLLDQLWEWGIGPGPTHPDASPERFMQLLGQLPLADQPGSRVRYHTSFDILSVLIERVSNEHLDAVLTQQIFAPLGMVDTAFWVPPPKQARLGVTRRTADDGSVEVWDEPNGRWSQPPEFRSGAAGLVSTTSDLVAFGRMLLSSGREAVESVLSPSLVTEMMTDQLTDEQATRARLGEEGIDLGWGYGIGVFRRPGPRGWPPAGSCTWDGGTGCRLLVVPEHDLCAVILTTDDFSSPAVPRLLTEFVTLVGEAVA